MKKENEILRLTDVTKSYPLIDEGFVALSPTSFVIHEGDYISIKGPSGSGKSTLMHIMGLLDSPTTGKVFLKGNDVSRLTEKELAKLRNKYIGFVFQSFHLLSKTPAWENVALPLLYAGVSRSERKRRSIETLTTMGMEEKINNLPSQLSGGQQQRVAISRALVNNPSLIFADEPTGNLDSKTGDKVMQIFDDLNKKGITVVLVTHEEEIARHAHERIFIVDGKVSRK